MVALGPAAAASDARGTGPAVLRLPGRSISVSAPDRPAGPGKAFVDVTVARMGAGPVTIARSDFTLSADGDLFGVQAWNAGRARIRIAPRRSRSVRLTFAVAGAAVRRASLFYRPGDNDASGVIALGGQVPAGKSPSARRSADAPTIKTFPVGQGVGEPWGTAIDKSGNVWFAEPGCDFAPRCGSNTAPGQIVKLVPSSGALSYYTLPSIPGNQPLFLAFDGLGNLWFTTPNNDMIGKFSPVTGAFMGQWAVTAGSGPWGLTFANGQLWYAEHLASAVGVFDPAAHTHQDFQTPSSNSNPYGIAADGGSIWFTENNSSVDRVARLDTTHGNAISEFPIVQPLSGTPHLIAIGTGGHPWWTEGRSNTVATLDPAAATPGSCGPASGTCNGISRFQVPPSTTCGGEAHTSGIAFDAASGRVWLDNSLTAQVGSFTPSTGTFEMSTLSNCGAHPHDGLSVDSAGSVWFDEEFANAIGELIPAAAPSPPPPATPIPATPPGAGVGIPSLAPTRNAAPVIHGRATQGRVLTADKGSWTNDPTGFSFTWQRCNPRCASVAHGTSPSLRLTARDIGARVRVIVTARNAAGSARAISRSVGPVGPSRSRVEAALSRLLAASTGRATISSLRRRSRDRAPFTAPSRGTLVVSWRGKGVAVATLRRRFQTAGTRTVTIPISASGKRLLKRSQRLTLVAKSVYIPAGARAVTSAKRFTLTAH